jgi:hypothetical protein
VVSEARNLPARAGANAPPKEAPSDAMHDTTFAEERDDNHDHNWSLL